MPELCPKRAPAENVRRAARFESQKLLPKRRQGEFRRGHTASFQAPLPLILGQKGLNGNVYLPPFQSGSRPGVGGAPAASSCFSRALMSTSISLRSFGISRASSSEAI